MKLITPTLDDLRLEFTKLVDDIKGYCETYKEFPQNCEEVF